MGKYEPLTHFLARSTTSQLPMSFEEIERLLGFPLPASSRSHRAWWSNNPSNNVMTKAWLAAGFETADVDVVRGRLVFRKLRDTSPQPAAALAGTGEAEKAETPATIRGPHPAFGAMRGLARIEPGLDLTQPADPDWARS
jgi:hypothetical protein